jgi:hypothetical protein
VAVRKLRRSFAGREKFPSSFEERPTWLAADSGWWIPEPLRLKPDVSRTNKTMLLYRPLRMRRWYTVTALALAMLSSPMTAQSLRPNVAVEDVVILRSLRLSRITPTDFCAPSRTEFSPATAEDRHDFTAVATDAASGKVTNAGGARVGTLHSCLSPTSDPLIASFYAEGEIGGVSLVGRGQCRTTKRDFPESGISLFTCQLDLTGLPSAYVGGQLTTNTLVSRTMLGAETDPSGYTQMSIATVRLWKKR